MGIKLRAHKEIVLEIERLPAKIYKGIMDVFDEGGERIRNRIVKSMTNTSRASYYYPKPGGKKHFPSLPFNPPAVDTGELRRSIFSLTDRGAGTVEVGATVGAPYAEFLELGTSDMDERPFLMPAVEEETPSIQRDVDRIMDKILGG